MVCATCLARLTGIHRERMSRLAYAANAALCLVGLLALWLFFYVMGEGLLSLPSSFHEGAVWKADTWEAR